MTDIKFKASSEASESDIPGDVQDLFGPMIDSYTRAQAIEDGVLVDVSETASGAGILFPVALTAAAFADCVAWTDGDSERTGVPQDEAGRLWDVVWMTRGAIRRARGRDLDAVVVELLRVRRDGSSRAAEEVSLVAKVGPGDEAEPVITILTVEEYRAKA